MSTQTLASQLSELSIKLVIYCWTPIYVIGILGNLLNIITFSRRTLRGNTCSQYFIGVSIVQIILFNSLSLTKIITNISGYDLGQTVAILCKIRSYLFIFSLGLMRQFLCLISIDRWIISTDNARIRKFSSVFAVRWLMIGSSLFWILYSIHILIGFQTIPTRGCTHLANPSYALFYVIQFTISSIIPFIIMTMFSIFTLRNMRNHGRIRIASQNTVPSSTMQSNLPQNIRRRRYEIQLIKLSLLQVIFYVFFSTLGTYYLLYSVITNSSKKSSDQIAIDVFLNNIALLLIYTYSSLTFVLYTLASRTFRKEFLLTCSRMFKYLQNMFLID
ncbi:unnamed protein product [Rotaria sordida]|uniref:G-protein coupled receptors family 1 profile domain-containing protein n=1 Tax=Rotaria sordida TaxID=392033 RepID=A0A819DDH6_9BILA|nr:unnamed protein product [Rotaria sordida]